ncbi:MAG: YbaK/EbsC family protein [bacterium]|nr:YbaK/EbsC family protein [bacterium]
MPNVPDAAAAVTALLDRLNARYQRFDHPAVHTCAEAETVIGDIPGTPSKCLLVKTSTKKFFLLLAPCRKRIHLGALATTLGCGRLSFATEGELRELLGLTPGSVSPFGVIHDRGQAVQVILDAALAADAYHQFHPNDNRATLALPHDDLMRFFTAANHPPRVLPLPEKS